MAESIAVFAFLISLVALFFANAANKRAETAKLREVLRRVGNLEADSVEDRDLYERLYKSVHKLRTRAGTEDARIRKANEAERKAEIEEAFDPDAVMEKYPLGVFSLPGKRQE